MLFTSELTTHFFFDRFLQDQLATRFSGLWNQYVSWRSLFWLLQKLALFTSPRSRKNTLHICHNRFFGSINAFGFKTRITEIDLCARQTSQFSDKLSFWQKEDLEIGMRGTLTTINVVGNDFVRGMLFLTRIFVWIASSLQVQVIEGIFLRYLK